MCTGRVDLSFILRAFSIGNDGVFIGGCRPGECHYSTEGNFHALAMVHIGKKLLEIMGLSPDRLRIEWISSSEGIRFAELMNDFSKKVQLLGPLGSAEGMNANGLKHKLEAAGKLIPYIKLVERERLRVKFASEEEYENFFGSDETNKIFEELVSDKLITRQIISLLEEKPLSAREISETLGLHPSEISEHLDSSAKQGLVIFDENRKLFSPACGEDQKIEDRE